MFAIPYFLVSSAVLVCIFAIPYVYLQSHILVSNPVCISAIYYGHGASTASGRRGGQAQGVRSATSTYMARGAVALSLGARAGGYGSGRKSDRWGVQRPFHLGRELYSCRKLCALAKEASNKEKKPNVFRRFSVQYILVLVDIER